MRKCSTPCTIHNTQYIFFILVFAFVSAQDIYLRLTDYAGGKTNLVTEPFRVLKGTDDLTIKTKTIEGIIKSDLEYSLYFDIFPDTTYLLGSKKKSGLILSGLVNERQLSIILADFESHNKVSEKGYTIEGEPRNLSHKIADEIIETLTGEKGISSTRIVFSYKMPRGKELGMIDYDGYNFASLTNNCNLNLFPCWSSDGNRILFSTYTVDRLNLYLLSLTKKSVNPIASYQGLNFAPCWSPDGTKICMSLTKDGNAEIYILDLNTKKLNRLTNNWAIDVSPAFSPNSREIAFVSDRSGGPQIYIMDLYGGNVRRLTFHGGYNTSPAWSPRGDLIVYVSREEDNSQQIYVTDPYDYMPIRLTYEGNNEEPSWSPDGLHIVFSSDRSGKYELYTMNWDGTRQRKLTNGIIANAPDWSPFIK